MNQLLQKNYLSYREKFELSLISKNYYEYFGKNIFPKMSFFLKSFDKIKKLSYYCVENLIDKYIEYLIKNNLYNVQFINIILFKTILLKYPLHILDKKIENNTEDIKNKEILFQMAGTYNMPLTFKKLLKKYDFTRDQKMSIFLKLAELGYVEIFSFLLNDKSLDIGYNNNHILCKICENGHTEMFKLLIKYYPEIDVNAQNGYPFCKSCENGHKDIAEMLLAIKNIKIMTCNNHAIYTAMRNKRYDIVKLFINNEKMIFDKEIINYAMKSLQDYKLCKILSYDKNINLPLNILSMATINNDLNFWRKYIEYNKEKIIWTEYFLRTPKLYVVFDYLN